MKLDVKGLHKFCMKCKRLCTNDQSRCGIKDIKAKNCKFKYRHHYQSRIWNPELKKIDNVRTWTGKTLEQSIKLHKLYKEHCKEKKPDPVIKNTKPSLLRACSNLYIDYLDDIDVPEHNRKKLGKNHIRAYSRYLKRFVDLIGDVSIYSIGDIEVGQFHKWVLSQNFSARSYNDHMICLRSFFDFLIKKGYELKNPFKDVSKKAEPKSREILTSEDLETLFKTITYENGKIVVQGKNINRCYDWLKDAIMLALLTGERLDGIFYLKWEHVEENYIKILNFKLFRLRGIEEYHYVPITTDLAELLLKLGYGDKDQYLLAPDKHNRETLKSVCSKAFTHFWRLTKIDKKLSFRNLRKTYITRIRMILGDKAKALNIHKSDDVQINHYINQLEVTKELLGVRLF